MMRNYNLNVRTLAVVCCAVLACSLSAEGATMVYKNTVLADNPVAFWRLGESSGTVMTDASGFGRNGTYEPGVILGAQGVGGIYSDLAANFNGTSSDAAAPGDTAYNFLDYTLEAWVKITGTPIDHMRIASRQDSQHWLLHTFYNGSVVRLSSYSSLDGTSNFQAGPDLNDGQFHHLAITRDTTADLISLYVDGLLVGSQVTNSNAAFSFTSTTPVRIGSWDTTQFFPGIIDEVALYGNALSAAQIFAHFEAGTAFVPAPEPSTGLLLGLGVCALAKRRRARRS